MDWPAFGSWLNGSSLPLIGLVLLGVMALTAGLGLLLRRWRERDRTGEDDSGQEGYIVSAVLGLLALLLGFTFSLAVDRFDARRVLVLEEANAIGATYLRTQLLAEPHRTRISDILRRYTDNRILLAESAPTDRANLLKTNDALVIDLWAATSAAFVEIKGLDFSSAYLDSVNLLIDLDASRKTARMARAPAPVFVVLFIYTVTTAGVLGYVLHGLRGRLAAGFLMGLLILSLLLVVDIDRPDRGGVVESQTPMKLMRDGMMAQPAATFDRWRIISGTPFPGSSAAPPGAGARPGSG